MGYRQEFEEAYDILIPEGYEIHHIDRNHDNNELSNLMILPKELHEHYHHAFWLFDFNNQSIKKDMNFEIISNAIGAENLRFTALCDLCNAIIHCMEWADYKDYLNDKVSNIHGIMFYRKSDNTKLR